MSTSNNTQLDHSKVKFPIKIIHWSLDYSGDDDSKLATPILLQEKNGPCPLIALINTLLLKAEEQIRHNTRNEIKITSIEEKKLIGVLEFKNFLMNQYNISTNIDLSTLLSHLGDLLLIYVEESGYHYEVDKLLANLPLLHTGLSVDPNLLTGDFTPNDIATTLFKLFDLKLKHGWVINQIDNENIEWNSDQQQTTSPTSSPKIDNYAHVVDLFNKLQTFDQIQDFLLDSSPLVEDNGVVDTLDHFQDKRLVQKWLDLNKTQLTQIGLNRLNFNLLKGEFIVFFRNNHFNTLFKKDEQEFYILLTDASFTSKSSKIIWQSLNSVSGNDDLFFTGDFLPILDIDQDLPPHDETHGSDYLLLKQLQEEEDQRMAKEMQASYNKPKPKEQPPVTKSSDSKEEKKKKKKKLGCVIT